MIKEFSGEYRWLSNFWLQPVIFEGFVYPSTENAYQAVKVHHSHLEIRKKFLNCSPSIAKEMGQMVRLREDWRVIRLEVMKKVNRFKFTKSGFLAEKLLSTGDKELIEGNNWGDTFWGVSLNTGKGENNLGKILMEIRTDLQN